MNVRSTKLYQGILVYTVVLLKGRQPERLKSYIGVDFLLHIMAKTMATM